MGESMVGSHVYQMLRIWQPTLAHFMGQSDADSIAHHRRMRSAIHFISAYLSPFSSHSPQI
jgi:hypothetical protein